METELFVIKPDLFLSKTVAYTCFILAVLTGAGCSRPRVTGPPIDLVKQGSMENLQRLMKENTLQKPKEGDYRIGPGDVLTIQMVGRTDILSETGPSGTEFTITENPMLALPHIGAIKVHGKTAFELQEDLKAAYAKWIIDPIPSVIIKKFQANQIAVLGAVKVPGKFPLDTGDGLLDGLFKAGGVYPVGINPGQAPGRFLKVYRERIAERERETLSLDDLIKRVSEGDRTLQREEIVVPIEDYLASGVMAFNIPLKANDIVYVVPAGAVNVQGRVNKPGVIYLGPSVRTVTQVITQAGGLKFGASSWVQLERVMPDGKRKPFVMNARNMIERTAVDFVVEDNDQIVAFNQWFRICLEFIGQVLVKGTQAGISASYNPVAPL